MKTHRKVFPLAIFMLFLATIHAKGQSIEPAIMNASGGHKAIAGNSYEWSIGEMTLVHTATASELIVTQGILQPTMSGTGVTEIPFLSHQISVYPNPTEGGITIAPNLTGATTMQIQLVDLLGRTILQRSADLMTGQEKQMLNLAPYAAGIYVLTVRAQHKTQVFISTYKIQKK